MGFKATTNFYHKRIPTFRVTIGLLLIMADSGCPLEERLQRRQQQEKRDIPKTSALLDDATADILEKKVPPYRPPGTGGKNSASITQGLMEDTGINVLVHPIKIPGSDD